MTFSDVLYAGHQHYCLCQFEERRSITAGEASLAAKPERRKVHLSTITVAEVQYGIEKAAPQWRQHNLALFAKILARLTVLPFDVTAAEETGRVRWALKQARFTPGAYDELIAAHAISQGMTLVTNNVRHFAAVSAVVSGLKVEDWTV